MSTGTYSLAGLSTWQSSLPWDSFAWGTSSNRPAQCRMDPAVLIHSPADPLEEARKKTVVVIDDDMAIRDSIMRTLVDASHIALGFESAQAYLANQFAIEPDCILIDLMLPDLKGISLCRHLSEELGVTSSFAIISGYADVQIAVEAMRLGAMDVLEKPFSQQRLLDVVARSIECTQAKKRRTADVRFVKSRISRLTPREFEILLAMSDGQITKEIAKRFGISARTVDVHRSRIMEKLELTSPTQLGYLISILHREEVRNLASV